MSSAETYFIDDAITAVTGIDSPPMTDESHLIGFALFPVLLWGLFTGQTG